MTVRIEFCGVPAAGKSTLCDGALRMLRERGRHVLGRAAMVDAGLRARDFGTIGNLLGGLLPGWRREFLGLPHGLNDWHRFGVEHPAFVSLLHGWLAAGETDETWRSAVLYSFLTSAFEFQLAREAERPVLMDEGFAQRFFSLRGYRGLGQPGDAALYAGAMPLPSALVVVTAPPDVCVDRVKKRAQIPLLQQGEPESVLPIRFAEGNAMLSELAGELERSGVPVLRVDGEGELESTVMKIADFAEPACARSGEGRQT